MLDYSALFLLSLHRGRSVQPRVLSSALIGIGLEAGGSGHDKGRGCEPLPLWSQSLETGRRAAADCQLGGKRCICQVPQ